MDMKKILLLLGIVFVSCTPRIKVLTYNVGNLSKFSEDCTLDVAGIVNELGADYVSFNELDSCNSRHNEYQLEKLALECNAGEYFFSSSFPFAGGGYGNGILSEKKIIDSYKVTLRRYNGNEQRSIAVIETKECVFASTHLDIGGEEVKKLQTRDINDWFALHYTGYDKPVILAGDFNYEESSEAYAELDRLWERLSPYSPTFPSTGKCIDYVFSLRTAQPVKVTKSKVIHKAGGIDATKVSDHLPVYVELKPEKKRKSFTFVQMTDPQVGFFDYDSGCMHSDSLFDAAVKEINRINPALVVITGDLVDCPREPDFSLQDSIYRANLAKLNPSIEIFELPGNHDIQPYNASKLSEYENLRGYSRFSVRRGDCAFIGIDSDCIKDNVTEIEDAQWAWLEKELSSSAGCEHRFIFLHCPVIRHDIDENEDYFNFPKDKRLKYIDLFKQYGVEAVFSGHTHMENYTEYDGIKFINAGPVGNALARGYPGFHIVNVTPGQVIAEYVATPIPEGLSKWAF